MKLWVLRCSVIICLLNLSARQVHACSLNSDSTSQTKRFFTAFGVSPFLSVIIGPTVSALSYQTLPPQAETAGFAGIFDWEFLFRFRYNISEMSHDHSLSISAIPSLGLCWVISGGDFGKDGAMSLVIPVIAEYNTGNVATYLADKDRGVVIGLGAQFIQMPLYGAQTYPGAVGIEGTYKNPAPRSWVTPVFEFGYRHWNERNRVKEVNFKVGYLPTTGPLFGGLTFGISWLKCIGY